jgi:hypothetical protein
MILLRRLSSAWRAITQGDTGFATPDVTRTQQFALGQAVIVVLIVLGFDLDEQTQQMLIALSASLGAALPLSDAVVRHGRANNIDKIARVKGAAPADDAAPATAEAAPGALALSDDERREIRERLLRLSAPRR